MDLDEFLAQADRIFFEGQELRSIVIGGQGVVWGEEPVAPQEQTPLTIIDNEGVPAWAGDSISIVDAEGVPAWEFAA